MSSRLTNGTCSSRDSSHPSVVFPDPGAPVITAKNGWADAVTSRSFADSLISRVPPNVRDPRARGRMGCCLFCAHPLMTLVERTRLHDGQA